jgi:hypothetical protein
MKYFDSGREVCGLRSGMTSFSGMLVIAFVFRQNAAPGSLAKSERRKAKSDSYTGRQPLPGNEKSCCI